jgi:hypothetical protein
VTEAQAAFLPQGQKPAAVAPELAMNDIDSLNLHRAFAAALVSLAVALSLALCPTAAAAQPVEVQVARHGDLVTVDVQAVVAAPADAVFGVLTDYAHMPLFLSTVKTSAVIGEHDGIDEVEQSGEARHGFLHFTYHTVRDIEAIDKRELRSHLVSGDFKSYEMTTKLVDQGASTLIEQHGEYVPNAWVPPGIGPRIIKEETAKGYGELIAEIMKRQGVASTSTSVSVKDTPSTPAAQ